jgi:hypothetical protein
MTFVTLLERHEHHPDVAVLLVVSIRKCRHPLPGGLLASEWSAGVVRPVFRSPEQRFGVGIVIADALLRSGPFFAAAGGSSASSHQH